MVANWSSVEPRANFKRHWLIIAGDSRFFSFGNGLAKWPVISYDGSFSTEISGALNWKLITIVVVFPCCL